MASEAPHFEWVEVLWISITFALHHYKVTWKKKELKIFCKSCLQLAEQVAVHSDVWVTGQTCFVPRHMECML